MSKLYTADGKRRSSQTHAKHPHGCSCGRTVYGNGGQSSHRKACNGYYLTTTQMQAMWREQYEQRRLGKAESQ